MFRNPYGTRRIAGRLEVRVGANPVVEAQQCDLKTVEQRGYGGIRKLSLRAQVGAPAAARPLPSTIARQQRRATTARSSSSPQSTRIPRITWEFELAPGAEKALTYQYKALAAYSVRHLRPLRKLHQVAAGLGVFVARYASREDAHPLCQAIDAYHDR